MPDVILLQHHRLWILTRTELRDLARRNGVKRGRNKQDTIDNLMDAGITQQSPSFIRATFESDRFTWHGYGSTKAEARGQIIKHWNKHAPYGWSAGKNGNAGWHEVSYEKIFIPSGERR